MILASLYCLSSEFQKRFSFFGYVGLLGISREVNPWIETMKYYRLDYCIATKEVGTQYPQVWDFIKGYKPEAEVHGLFSLYESHKNGFPDKTPDLSGLKLANGAQFSDFLSQPFTSDIFLLNEKAKRVFESLHIDGEYRVYPAQVTSMRKRSTRDYYMMQILSENIGHVDFANSTLIQKHDNQRVPIQHSSYQEFIDTASTKENPRKWIHSFRFANIKMIKEFHNLGKDMFQIGTIEESWYVSQRFIDAVNENGLTGLEFEEVDL